MNATELARKIVRIGKGKYLGYEIPPEIVDAAEAVLSGQAGSTADRDDLTSALRATRDALSLVMREAPGYDWNADPLGLTLITGQAFSMADQTLANIPSPDPAHGDPPPATDAEE